MIYSTFQWSRYDCKARKDLTLRYREINTKETRIEKWFNSYYELFKEYFVVFITLFLLFLFPLALWLNTSPTHSLITFLWHYFHINTHEWTLVHIIPASPSSPFSPFLPSLPSLPGIPTFPSAPGAPLGPGLPGRPGDPGTLQMRRGAPFNLASNSCPETQWHRHTTPITAHIFKPAHVKDITGCFFRNLASLKWGTCCLTSNENQHPQWCSHL